MAEHHLLSSWGHSAPPQTEMAPGSWLQLGTPKLQSGQLPNGNHQLTVACSAQSEPGAAKPGFTGCTKGQGAKAKGG